MPGPEARPDLSDADDASKHGTARSAPGGEDIDVEAARPIVAGRGNPKWQKGMPSPNPYGRPPGVTDRKTKLMQRMLDESDGILETMIGKAREGDTAAASLLLSRVLPVLRPQSEKVIFALDAAATMSKQVEQVLDAIAKGEVAPDVGKRVIEAIQALGNVRTVEDLEKRISLLEEKAI